MEESPLTSDNDSPPTVPPFFNRPVFPPSSKLLAEPLNGYHDRNSGESVRTWLQRITQMQNEIHKKLNAERNAAFGDFSIKTSESPVQSPSRVVKYQDLPYMGEMTLDNSKPRRGRKPKKADICHLIYKNYGTIYPGTPNPKSLVERECVSRKVSEKSVTETCQRSDVQNRIISSLLERRLTQECKRSKEVITTRRLLQKPAATVSAEADQNEPLNLCIRDLNQLKIRRLTSDESEPSSEIKSEPQSDDEVEFVQETPPSPANRSEPKFPVDAAAAAVPETPPENGVGPSGYVYWPNAGVFIHPMALQQQLMYYQRLAATNNYTLPSHSPRPPPPPLENAVELKKVPKQRTKKPEDSDSHASELKTKRNAPTSTEKTPTKRKRSAIFIPPIPTENQTNPATEVSICKFKFTGGAKPSLQEKKMLSVDSGGNFRYYSGTGDKSMRGYEFFPRETLQQQIGNSQGSSTGAFLQASGEKIYTTSSPIDFPGKQPPADFLLSPAELPSSNALQDARQKKRKSRKSLQREKLEQTFKEKGFLIQTQQLESAEGATYCKFRQLRKFTRYLFRSWKDYLPGNVRELHEGEKSENDDVPEHDLDGLSRQSSSSGVLATDVQ